MRAIDSSIAGKVGSENRSIGLMDGSIQYEHTHKTVHRFAVPMRGHLASHSLTHLGKRAADAPRVVLPQALAQHHIERPPKVLLRCHFRRQLLCRHCRRRRCRRRRSRSGFARRLAVVVTASVIVVVIGWRSIPRVARTTRPKASSAGCVWWCPWLAYLRRTTG